VNKHPQKKKKPPKTARGSHQPRTPVGDFLSLINAMILKAKPTAGGKIK